MTGSQMFILIFMLGGAIAAGFFFIGLGIYNWGKNSGGKSKEDDHR